VYSEKTPDDGQRNCPNHVEFYSKNKFEKLMHLVGFIIRMYGILLPNCMFLYLCCLQQYIYFVHVKLIYSFSIYFWNKTLHVSDSSSVHHQEFFTVYTAMVCVLQVCWQFARRLSRKLSANLYDIYHCCVYSAKPLMMDIETVRNM